MGRRSSLLIGFVVLVLASFGLAQCMVGPEGQDAAGLALGARAAEKSKPSYVVLAYNDLGMHCMNESFAEFMILPPFNTLHAQVIKVDGEKPQIVTSGITVGYSVPGNTTSAGKTDFWQYCGTLLGCNLQPDEGLYGSRLSGLMSPSGKGDWLVAGIPLTPVTDAGQFDPFQLATVVVKGDGEVELARTQAVTPVSWELRCDLCHHGDMDAPVSVLDAHDRLHGTTLYNPVSVPPDKAVNDPPILCGSCHAQPELGLSGDPARENLSLAIHKAHAGRMDDVVSATPKGVVCFACHPGVQEECLRDTHAQRQMNCSNCHADGTKDWQTAMLAVGDPSRQPWASEPSCGSCHHNPGHEYEQKDTLFRNSIGHGGLFCEACHNSTHAITMATDAADNVQSISLQNHAGSIRKCTICHAEQPKGQFLHQAPPKL